MAQSSGSLHESDLKKETIDRHRAIVSLMEELEAVDWYDQRAEATSDEELKTILEHNRDEEKEHASMVLEWLRRKDASWDEYLRTYLFTSGSITDLEAAHDAEESSSSGGGTDPGGASRPADGSLGIGSLRGKE